MTTIQVQTQLSFEALLNSLQQLEVTELDQIVKATSLLRARKRALSLTVAETELLQTIQNSHIPADIRQRCAQLTIKQNTQLLSQNEQQELSDLIDQMELMNSQRIKHLIDLAQLRQVTLDALMAHLEIKPFSYE